VKKVIAMLDANIKKKQQDYEDMIENDCEAMGIGSNLNAKTTYKNDVYRFVGTKFSEFLSKVNQQKDTCLIHKIYKAQAIKL